jgi:hypothetical protein
MPGGRPTVYDDRYPKQAEKLCELGATDEQIADFFEVAPSTLYLWKHQHPEFSEALKAGKGLADERVARSLYQRAVGYEYDAVKVFMPGGAAEPVYAPIRERMHPDTTAAIFWLKNRRPAEWRDKQDHAIEHGGSVGIALVERVIVDAPKAAD